MDANGLLTAPSYLVQGATYNNLGSALGVLDTQTTTNTGDIATNRSSIAALQSGQTGVFRADNSGGAAPSSASGANAVAGGYGANASGGSTTALGTGARATQFGATAIGAGAVASGDPTTAVGFNAAATGAEASAFGAFAQATGDNSTALGRSASAGGNATAIGVGATAGQADSVALGAGVTTTRANQVAIGTAGQTYTLAGIASVSSLAAQSGPTGFVTTDANGNLAATSIGPGTVAALEGRVGSLENRAASLEGNVIQLRRDMKRGFEGTAIAMAMGGAILPPGKNYALSGGWGTFRGENAFAVSGVARLSDNVFAQGGVGFGTDRGGVGGRAGLTFAW